MTLNTVKHKKISFYMLLIVLAFFVLEISLHLIYKLTNSSFLFERVATPIFMEDKYCCYKNKPNLEYLHSNPEFKTIIYTDNNGTRVASKKKNAIDSNKKNILILGPSFSFGHGVNYEDSYSYKLQKYFSNYNFMNGSVPGHPPELNICWLINNINNYKPDIIIQNIFDAHILDISNIDDIKNYCESYCKKINVEITKSGYLKNKGNIFNTVKGRLKNSSIIFYTWYFYEQYIFENKKNVINEKIGKQFYNEKTTLDEKQIELVYKKHEEVLKKINPDLKIFYVFIPPNFIVSDKYSHRYNLSNRMINIHNERYKYYVDIMEKNFNIINTYSMLKESDKLNQTYYNVDVHFTKFGNQVVFDILKKYFEEKI